MIPASVRFADIGPEESVSVRDLWAKKNLGRQHGSFSTDVTEHGGVLLRIH